MKKKYLRVLILVLLVSIAITATVVMTSCSGKQGDGTPTTSHNGSGTGNQSAEQYVELNESKITLDKSNDITLQCTVVGVSDPVVWSSSDTSVATVDNGKVIAMAAGETEITAAAGSLNAKCTVTVEDKGVVPAMSNYRYDFEIRRTHTYDVSPVILFAGSQKDIKDAELIYEVADSTVATIDENGIATALKEGTTTFTVSGSFRGIKMLPITGTIEVKKNITVAMNSLNVNLYACNPDGTYETQFQLESAVYVENAWQNGAELVWSSEDEKIATVENGLITAHRAGTVMVNAAYTAGDGDIINAGVVVNVERPVINLDGMYEFDLSNKGGSSTMDLGELVPYVDGIFTGFFDITDEERQEIVGASYKGKLSLPNKNFVKHGFRRYALESELVSIHFDGLAITKKIYSVSDLASIATTGNTLDGYYRLERDVDAGGRTVKLVGGWSNGSTKGFIGTFEGNGHTISNLNVGSEGLFNCIGAGTVRNLGLANVSGSKNAIATEVHDATIENVAVSSRNCEMLFSYVGSRSKIINLVSVLDNGKYVIQTYGSASDAENTVQNFLVVAGKPESNDGWSGTRVPGIFYNYYHKDEPMDLYDLTLYGSKEEMIRELKNNGIPGSIDFGVRLEGSKLYYNDAVICGYEIDVTAPATVHRGTSCTVKALDSTFSLKKSIKGISVNSQTGVVSVAKDVPEFTEFTVVVQHKEYTDVRAEVTIRVTINYKPVQTDVAVRYDLSTGAAAYSFTIPEFADTFKRIGWQGTDGFSEGVTVENGVFTLTADVVKALGSGDGILCVYTEEENVFYVDAIIADKFIYTYDDLAALYQSKTLDGYYMLANNIDANNSSALTLIGTWTNKSNEGFIGTFNGDGHTISNIKVGSAGLFGYIGTGTVKNLALVNVYGGVNAIANEAHGMTFENVFFSSPDAVRGFTWVGDSSTKNVIAVLPKGQHYINTNGSAAVHNSHKNIYVVVGDPTTNDGWSGTKVVGFFQNYYSFDNPNAKYNLKHYYTAADLLAALEKNNTLASWTDSAFTYEGGAVLFGGNMVVTPEIVVTGPSIAYRGQTTKLEAAGATFSLKGEVVGITVSADGTITVADDVPEQTEFTVVATHSVYSQFVKEVTLTVAIDYNEIDQTDIPVEFDLSTNASRYRYTIPNFEGTYKAIGWEGEGFIDANGVSVRNGQLTMTKIAMAAIGSGSGTLCVYTEEEDVYLLNVTIADMFIDNLAELKSIAKGTTMSGYYILAADIDCGGEQIILSCYTSTADAGFIGTFDGRGHTISNVNVGAGGLFDGIGAGTVKNLALVNVIGTGSAIASETHECTIENVFVSSNSCLKAFNYVGDSSFKNIIVVLPGGQNVIETFGAANVSNTISNVYSVIAEPVTNSGWSGTKVVGFFRNYYKNDDPKALYNLRHFTTVTELMDSLVNGDALSAIDGSFGVSNSCLTFGGKMMLVPFAIECPNEAPRGGSITAQAPKATFALKEPVEGISVGASTGKITVDATVEPGTTFIVTATSSLFPGYITEKQLTVVINWQNVDWTANGSLTDMGKGAQAVLTLPEAINGNLVQITCGEVVFTEGFSYADGILTLTADLVDAMYAELGYGDHTLNLCADSEYSYTVTVTMFTKIITSYEDLESIKENQVNGVLDGYYILANDIDAAGKAPICLVEFNDHINNKANSGVGFVGIFDGRGHTISNLTVKTGGYAKVGGLFGQILNPAIIRNVAFVDMTTDGVGYKNLMTGESGRMTGLMENVFISAKGDVEMVFGLFSCDPSNTETVAVGRLRNVIITDVDYISFGFINNPVVENVIAVVHTSVTKGTVSGTGNTSARDKVTVYDTVVDMLNALKDNNVLTDWNSSITFTDGKLYYNGKVVAQ